MNRINIYIFIILMIISFCSVKNVEARKSNYPQKSLLWKISGNGLRKPSYLFGTVHMLDSSYYFLDKTTVEQLRKSDVIVFENDLDEPGYQQQILKLAMMEDDSLTHFLTADEYKKLEEFFKNEFNFPLAAVKNMKPFYVASLIDALSLPQDYKSYEAELLKLASKLNKEVLGITKPETENEIISQIPINIQIKQIWESIWEYEKGYPLKQKIMTAYEKRDIAQIYSLMKENTEGEEIVYNLMFPRRHEIWVPGMVKLMKQYSCFFAVGVGHLPGEQGLLEWFQKKGFKVRPVHSDFKLHD